MLRALALLLLAGLALLAYGYRTAVQMPVERPLTLALTDWPKDAPGVRVMLISDLHVVGPEAPPERLARVVARVNALEPDLVLIAGDVLSYRALAARIYSVPESIAPLGKLHARFGVLAVPGNHDYPEGKPQEAKLPAALEAIGIPVLQNQAVRRGALTNAGADDYHAGQFRYDQLDKMARTLPGPTILLSHSPDIAASIPPRHGILFAGHTHCGQMAIPFYGPLETASQFGKRFAYGAVREGNRLVLVTAGIGTSVLPSRLFVPPELWVVTLGASALTVAADRPRFYAARSHTGVTNSMKPILFAAAAFACIAPLAASAQTAPAQTTTAPAATFSAETPIEQLVANPKAKAVLAANGMADIEQNPYYDQFKAMSLQDVQPMSQGKLTVETVAKVDAELKAIK